MKDIDKYVTESFDQLEILQEHCESYFIRNKYVIYKAISATLRLLLLGSSGDKALIDDVLPKLILPQLMVKVNESLPTSSLVLPSSLARNDSPDPFIISNSSGRIALTGKMQVVCGRLRLIGLFNFSEPRISLKLWLEQGFLFSDWTLRDFISKFANKDGGAHFETGIKPLHLRMQQIKDVANIQEDILATITSEIIPIILEQLIATYPNHIKSKENIISMKSRINYLANIKGISQIC